MIKKMLLHKVLVCWPWYKNLQIIHTKNSLQIITNTMEAFVTIFIMWKEKGRQGSVHKLKARNQPCGVTILTKCPFNVYVILNSEGHR